MVGLGRCPGVTSKVTSCYNIPSYFIPDEQMILYFMTMN